MFVSARYWPVVVAKFPALPSDDDYRAAMGELGRIIDAHSGKFVVLVDSLDMEAAPNAGQRKILNDFATSRHETTLARGLGTSFAVRSKLIRAALTAMDWLYRRPTPTSYHPTLTDAIEWCLASLEQSEVMAPDLSAAALMNDASLMGATRPRRSVG